MSAQGEVESVSLIIDWLLHEDLQSDIFATIFAQNLERESNDDEVAIATKARNLKDNFRRMNKHYGTALHYGAHRFCNALMDVFCPIVANPNKIDLDYNFIDPTLRGTKLNELYQALFLTVAMPDPELEYAEEIADKGPGNAFLAKLNEAWKNDAMREVIFDHFVRMHEIALFNKKLPKLGVSYIFHMHKSAEESCKTKECLEYRQAAPKKVTHDDREYEP